MDIQTGVRTHPDPCLDVQNASARLEHVVQAALNVLARLGHVVHEAPIALARLGHVITTYVKRPLQSADAIWRSF